MFDGMIFCDLPSDMEYVDIHPLGDVHLGDRNAMLSEVRKKIDEIANDDNARAILTGDLINNGVKSSVTNVYEEVIPPSEQKLQMITMLEPIKHKVIGMTAGNHELRTYRDSDQDIALDIAYALGIEHLYRREMGIIKISIGEHAKAGRGRKNVYMGAFMHGSGGGTYIGSGANRQERFINTIEGIDFTMSGHTHKPFAATSSRVIANSNGGTVRQRSTVFMVATAWLRYGGYAAEKQLSPAAIAPNKLRLYGNEHRMVAIG